MARGDFWSLVAHGAGDALVGDASRGNVADSAPAEVANLVMNGVAEQIYTPVEAAPNTPSVGELLTANVGEVAMGGMAADQTADPEADTHTSLPLSDLLTAGAAQAVYAAPEEQPASTEPPAYGTRTQDYVIGVRSSTFCPPKTKQPCKVCSNWRRPGRRA
jgi:hypothetical protein